MPVGSFIAIALNGIAIIGFYITLISYRDSKEDNQTKISLFFENYSKQKEDVSLEVYNAVIKQNSSIFYRAKRLFPWKSFEGYTELYISCDGIDFSQKNWESAIQRANMRASSQFEDNFHLNKNTHFSTVDDVWLSFEGKLEDGAKIAVRTSDQDILKYVVDFILFPAVVRIHQGNMTRE